MNIFTLQPVDIKLKKTLRFYIFTTILFLTLFCNLSTVNAQSGLNITEFSIPTNDSFPINIAVGADGNIWFSEYSAGKIGKMTPQGEFTEFLVPTSSPYPNDVTLGHDGNIWFTEARGFDLGKIAKITPDGVITEYEVPTLGSSPGGIVAGPNNSMWFVEYFSNKIGKMSPEGTFTEYPIPTPDSRPYDMTNGPDGSLWFTEHFGNKIGKITSEGIITEFSIATPESRPAEIVAGPDGNLWFTQAAGGKIAKITTAGEITEYPLPNGNSPYGITVGPDGNIWFTDNGNHVGNITTDGVISQFQIPTSSSNPLSMTTDSNGNIWFTEGVANKIGKITLNNTPVINPIGNKSVAKGGLLEFTVSATDPDESDTLTYTANNLPSGSSLNSITGLFSWTPDQTQTGEYIIHFTATDDGTPSASSTEEVTITVLDNLTPAEQIAFLISDLNNQGLSTKIKKSYIKDLKKLADSIEDGKLKAVRKQLNAFIGDVEKDFHKEKITEQQYNYLVTAINKLIADLGL